MHLMQNAETIKRLEAQGEFLLKALHAKNDKAPADCETEFLRGEFAGWRDTLHTLYHESGEGIVNCVLTKTGLTIPRQRGRIERSPRRL